MSTLISFYSNKAKQLRDLLGVIKKRINLLSVFRLASFMLLTVTIYFYLKTPDTLVMLAGLILFVVFVVLVKINFRLKDEQQLNEKLLFVNNNELEMLRDQANQFPDGSHFVTHKSYTSDLDVFGPGSVFHLLNRTTTSHGEARLAGLLANPFSQKTDMEEYQQAVQALSGQVELRQLLTANGLLHDEHNGNLHTVTEFLQTKNQLSHLSWLRLLRWILPAYNVFFALYYIATDHLQPLLIGLGLALSLTGTWRKYINSQHALLSKKKEVLDQYGVILKVFSRIDPGSSVKLQSLKMATERANHAMKKFSQLSSFFDQRNNLVVLLFLMPLFLYDIQCMLALEQWKEKYKGQFEGWIACVADMECLASLACFAFNHPSYVFPEIHEEGFFIESSQMGHPLIPAGENVPNDFSIGIKNKLLLVTGSNMSGKTTFLRTAGVNLLLAQCGASVCALRFSFTPMAVLSSIRVSDSLQEHTSYFMAELKRLEQIIARLKNGKPALVLIDEILRGTNSEDKTYGSEQFIRKLLQYPCLSLFATHDLSLSKMEDEFPGKVANFCFESIIEHDELRFDYRLQQGVAKNKNASFLMRKMQII